MLRVHALLAVLFLVILGSGTLRPSPVEAVDGCPVSTIECDGTTSSTEPIRSVDCDDWLRDSFGSAGHDLLLGRVRASGSGGDSGGRGSVRAVDDYTVIGLPTGTPLTFTATLRVIGYVSVGCYGYDPSGNISGRLTEGSSNTVEVRRSSSLDCDPQGYSCCGVGASVDSTLRVDIVATAGAAFRLTSEVGASVRFGSTSVTGQLAFEGLPPGTSIVSCQGYRQEFPVPATTMSWGALKVRYH
jgi:hypothetical protein